MSVDYRPDYDPADVDSDYGHTGGDITVPTFTANMKPFRFWCQKALPLVYDDSLSYYEVLCKVVKQMNDFLTDLQTATGAIDQFAQQFVINQQFLNEMADQLGQNIEDLETYINERMTDFMTAYTQLQDYVNNYFDNLDVQQEINNKLDEMASDGTFNDLFDPVITAWMAAKTAQIDAAIAGQDAIQAQQNGRISVLEGRMDTFSSLPSGSTSGNAELLDIRTNFLGEVYPTAGEAVRASDMIASGFQSISATKLEEWDGNDNSSVYDTIQIDISGYKGGHVVVIGSFKYFQSDLTTTGTCSVYATNTPGKVEDANAVNYLPGITNSIFKDFTQLTTSISGEERLLLQFAIPDDYAYQYLKIGHFEHNALTGSYTEPLYIVYANSWSRTPVDDTLTIAGDAADAKATGDALDELNERLSNEANLIGYFSNSFAVTAGTSHSSTADVLKTVINAGQKFKVDVKGNISNAQIFALYENGTIARLVIAKAYEGTATSNIVGISVFIDGTWIANNTTVNVVVTIDGSINNTLLAIEANVDNLDNLIGYDTVTFNVTAGSPHLSTADVLKTNIKAGQIFKVDVNSSITTAQIYAYYADGTSTRLVIAKAYNGTASSDIIGIGVYIVGSDIPADTTVTVTATVDGSIGDGVYTDLPPLIERVDDIDDLIGYKQKTFNVRAGVNHSAVNDRLSVSIAKDTRFYVYVSGAINGYQIYARYSDSTSAKLSTNTYYDGIASKNIITISIFVDGTDIPADTTVTFTVIDGDSIYGRLKAMEPYGVDKRVITTVLGAELPNDLTDYGVTSAYAETMKSAVDNWMGYYAGDSEMIPFIVHTDQHGRLTPARRGLFSLLSYIVNWNEISAIFNLGDTIVDHWTDDPTNTNPLLRNATLEDAMSCLKDIPVYKQINVYGNHDTWYSGDVPTTVNGVLPSLQYNNPYFTANGLVTKVLTDNKGLMTVYDEKNNVKYLVLAGWDYSDNPGQYVGYQWYWINKEHIEWIINQMLADDGYDLVLVSHVPLEMGGTGSIDPITLANIELENPTYITHYTNFLVPLWNARKAKTSGNINYNGETITFDFTGCKTDCLCALAGHTHYDGVEYLNNTGLLQVAFDWFTNNTIHFGIIDRRNKKVKCWKLSNDGSPAVNTWEMPFDKA